MALDFSGAFDAIDWRHVVNNVIKSNINNSLVKAQAQLLIDRTVEYNSKNRTITREIKIGCPQGGKASPCIWNITMNDLLINLTKEKLFNIAYADDLTVIIDGESVKEMKVKMIKTLSIIDCWCKSTGLKLSTSKLK